MGLDIYFIKRPRTTGDTKPATGTEPEKVGYYRKFNALLNWVDTHVADVENCEDVPLARADLEALQADLQRLNPESSAEIFPTAAGFFFGSQVYDESYWSEVEDLKTFVAELLDTFDFEHSTLCFHAWW